MKAGEIQVNWWCSDSQIRANVEVCLIEKYNKGRDYTTYIDVSRGMPLFMEKKLGQAEVNWGAIGATPVKETKYYIKAIQQAIKLAEVLDEDMFTWEVVTYAIVPMKTNRFNVIANNEQQIEQWVNRYNDVELRSITKINKID